MWLRFGLALDGAVRAALADRKPGPGLNQIVLNGVRALTDASAFVRLQGGQGLIADIWSVGFRAKAESCVKAVG